MCLFDLLDRHEVRDLRHPLRGEKARQENIGIWQIELLLTGIRKLWGNLKPPALLGVQESGKDGGRIEVGKCQKVDRAIHPHQGHGIEVPNDSVVFDGLIASGWYL